MKKFTLIFIVIILFAGIAQAQTAQKDSIQIINGNYYIAGQHYQKKQINLILKDNVLTYKLINKSVKFKQFGHLAIFAGAIVYLPMALYYG